MGMVLLAHAFMPASLSMSHGRQASSSASSFLKGARYRLSHGVEPQEGSRDFRMKSQIISMCGVSLRKKLSYLEKLP